jgi:hypothetical protein
MHLDIPVSDAERAEPAAGLLLPVSLRVFLRELPRVRADQVMHPPRPLVPGRPGPGAQARPPARGAPRRQIPLRGAWSGANFVVQVHRVIEVVPDEARETRFPAHPLG